MKRKVITAITFLIIIGIVAFSFFVLGQKNQETPDDITKCIGKNSVLYVQLGCHACEAQENLFGESYQHLSIIDCFYEEERQKCLDAQITATPTWIINNKKYIGVQSIEKLRELTGC